MTFEELICVMPKEPMNYFDFPASLWAFARALTHSQLGYLENDVLVRSRGKQMTILAYTHAATVRAVLQRYTDMCQLRTVNFIATDTTGLQKIPYHSEWIAPASWIPPMTGKRGYEYRRSEKRYAVSFELPRAEELDAVFSAWVEGARLRHFMVIQGHYKKYLQDALSVSTSIRLLCLRNKLTGELWGVAGYELWGGAAQITIMKHRFGDHGFPLWFWAFTVYHIVRSEQVGRVFCGTTADVLKRHLGLTSVPSYKIKWEGT